MAQSIISLLVAPLARLENVKSQSQNLLATSMMIIRTMSSHESSCLPNCRPLNAVCCLVLYSPSKKLVFVHVASAMAGAHRDRLVLASNARQPEI
jgi:hypothetical protein